MQAYHLEVFTRVVDCGSFSQAALELFITQPAVSQHVKALEKTLGMRLLERGPGGLTLTEAGEIVYRFARQSLHAQSEMRRLLDALQAGNRGRVSVGASSTGVLYYLPSLLRQFRVTHAGVEVTLASDITDRLRAAVIDQQMDVALVWGPVAEPRLTAVTLHRAPFVVICAPDHPLAAKPVVSPSDLAAHPFIMNLRGTTTRQFIESTLREAGVVPQVAMEGTSTENIKRVVEAGLGLALVARRAVEPEVALGTLRLIPVTGLQVRREITLIIHAKRRLTPAVSRFVAFVQASGAVLAQQDER